MVCIQKEYEIIDVLNIAVALSDIFARVSDIEFFLPESTPLLLNLSSSLLGRNGCFCPDELVLVNNC